MMYGDRLPVLWALKWFACKLITVPDPDLEIKGGGGGGMGADLIFFGLSDLSLV